MRVSRAARPQNTPTQRVSERKHITHRREDNIAISRAYFELLREQGFFNQ